jgi:hypothetical protein
MGSCRASLWHIPREKRQNYYVAFQRSRASEQLEVHGGLVPAQMANQNN